MGMPEAYVPSPENLLKDVEYNLLSLDDERADAQRGYLDKDKVLDHQARLVPAILARVHMALQELTAGDAELRAHLDEEHYGEDLDCDHPERWVVCNVCGLSLEEVR